jgi:hypothetical protein
VYKAWGANDKVLGYIIICFFGVFGVFGPCVKIGHLFLRRRAATFVVVDEKGEPVGRIPLTKNLNHALHNL